MTQNTARFLIAMDSFKGSASSLEIGSYVRSGILKAFPQASIELLGIADGGEGTVEALLTALDGEYHEQRVKGPRGKEVLARYGSLGEGTAVIEMAAASGLTLLQDDEKDPFLASSYGTGQLIRAALDEGVRKLYIGIGGSATNDAGMGMAQALGIAFLDEGGNRLADGPVEMNRLASIDFSKKDSRLDQTEIIVLTDVSNPLYGKEGASFVFGQQKGAKEAILPKLDKALRHFAEITGISIGKDFSDLPGAGAAGGLGFGLMAFCAAEIKPGIETLLDLVGFDKRLEEADCVITGEGRMDSQTAFGKAPVGIAKRAKAKGLPVIAVVGSRSLDLSPVYEAGVDLVIDLINEPMELADAISQTAALAESAGESAARAFFMKSKK